MRYLQILSMAILHSAMINFFSYTSGVDASNQELQYEWDDYGYVLYCPCAGRFGNQAAHFLGALEFAKKLNRTLVIPPWISNNRNVPFTDWFQLESVQSYHKSLPLEDFMEQLAPEKWPPGNRTGYCFELSRNIIKSCNMKNGDTASAFWDGFGVEFDDSEFVRLHHITEVENFYEMWLESYPPTQHPVLAFKGAPASYPVWKGHRQLQQYVRWNDKMNSEAEEYIKHTIGDSPYIGVHIRMEKDWERLCKVGTGNTKFMESDQCLEDISGSTITKDLCLPSVDVVTKHVLSLIEEHGTMPVFLASDVSPEVHNVKQMLGRKIPVYYLNSDRPELDLILLGKADYFVGNCISSFSAFVKRERDVNGKLSQFFALEQLIDDLHRMNRKIEL